MAMKGDREACLSAGVNDYISKPLDLSELAKMIAKYSNK
jgi:CheY-like chemotaxis protein